MPCHTARTPSIEYRLIPRFAIDVKEHWVAFLRVKIRRLDHPAVKLHAFAPVSVTDAYFEKFLRALFELVQPFLQFAVINQRPHVGVLRQTDNLGNRWLLESRIGVNCQLAARRNVVIVRAWLTGRRQAFSFAVAVEPHTEEIFLRRVLR